MAMSDYCRRCQQHFSYCGCTEIERLSDRIEALEAENARLRKALKRYGDKVADYVSDDTFTADDAYDWLQDDGGETARAALAELNGQDDEDSHG
jgi:hypothetical protein